MTGSAKPLPRVLLFEQHFVMRRTIVTVARDLGVAEIQEASTIDRARVLLATSAAFEAVVLDFDDGARTVDLLGELRHGKFNSRADAPVVVIAAELGRKEEDQLAALAVCEVLRKPFKIGDLLNVFVNGGVVPPVRL